MLAPELQDLALHLKEPVIGTGLAPPSAVRLLNVISIRALGRHPRPDVTLGSYLRTLR